MFVQRFKPITVFLLFFLCLSMFEQTAQAVSLEQSLGECQPAIVVTNQASNGAGTLRQALLDICDGGTITFGFVQPVTINLFVQQLLVNLSVTIDAASSPGVTISGNDVVRIFSIEAGNTVTLSDLTLVHGAATLGGAILNAGSLTLDHVSISDSTAQSNEQSFGGALYNAGGFVTLTNSLIVGNVAAKNYIYPSEFGGDGGGVYNQNGVMIVQQSEIRDNLAELGSGGGIYNESGILVVRESTIVGNDAGYEGGGLYNSGNLTVLRSTVSGNYAYRYGGGISQAAGSLQFNNSTLSGNTGRVSAGPDYGAGLFLHTGDVSINNSTVTNNVQVDYGGGLYNEYGFITVTNSLIAGNSGNGADCYGTVTSQGYNLAGLNTGCTGFTNVGDQFVATNLIFTTVLSNLLADNGGPTQTHHLLPGSPAINAGNDLTCLAVDQRNLPRPQSTSCDIGALEVESDVELSLSFAPLAHYQPSNQPFAYQLVIENGGPEMALGMVLTDTLPADLTFLSANSPIGTCDYILLSGEVVCNLSGIPANGSNVVNINVLAPDYPAVFTNTATIVASQPEAYILDNSAAISNTICYCTDLVLVQTHTPDEPYSEEVATFTIVGTNVNGEIATRVHITDTLPADTTFITYTTSQGVCDYLGLTVACNWDTLLPGESAVLNILLSPNHAGIITNTATIGSYENDYTPDNNSSQDSVMVKAVADLALYRMVNPGIAIVGHPYSYTVLLQNQGPDAGRYIQFLSTLPSSFDYVAPPTDLARVRIHFEESTGATTFTDSSDYQHNLTCTPDGTCPTAGLAGRYGAGLAFDGGDYITGQNGNPLNPAEELTVAIWVYASNSYNDRKIVSKMALGTPNAGYVLGHIYNKLYPEVWDSAGVRYTFQSGTIPSNAWTHIAITWKTNGFLVGYVNGVEVGRVPTGQFPISSNSAPFTVGAASNFTLRFSGRLDELIVLHQALSAGEIRQLFVGGYVAECTGVGAAVACDVPTLAPEQVLPITVNVLPTESGWQNYRADVSSVIRDHNLTNNTAYLKTRVVELGDIDVTVDVAYLLEDDTSGTSRIWLLQDSTFVDNVGRTGIWMNQPVAPEYSLQYDPTYACEALMIGKIFVDEEGEYLQGVLQCQDGSLVEGIWFGFFVTTYMYE